ncbi:NAD(P)-dependent oxidoreductase [Candidatus Uabimicrobium sp. HlEnr_7]|uniref:NAD(P)-dependent oxidoreductase n=1 Tax=Candidatus Uabimicrobium helgolandensis TaxID=3095367 RepID=UPI003556C20B
MKILICDAFDSSLPEKLAKYGEVFSDKERLAEANIALIRSKTKSTKEWIDKAPELKMIIRGGVGLDNVDLDYAKQKGIRVDNTPEASSIAVAEMAFAMMIAMPCRLTKAHNGMVAGEWLKKQCKRTELCNKTLGLVGYGRIAKELAKRAAAFSMNVIAYKRTAATCEYAQMKSLEEVLTQSDFISLHTPLNDESRGLVNSESIKKMKKGVYVINTGRGECIVEKDVCEALNSGHIAGYAADVWEKEPPEDRTLVETTGCLATPHIASSTTENLLRIGEIIEQKIANFVK